MIERTQTAESALRAYVRLVVESTLDEDDINEFSSCGGGAIMGYSLPLGANPDAYGRQKNKQSHGNKKKRKNK